MVRLQRPAAVLIASTVPAAGSAADVAAYLVATSDYVYRGVTYSDGHAAGQAGVDVNFDSGAYLGLWGSTIDVGAGTGRERDRQVNYYAGYLVEATRRLSVGFNVVAYTFPAMSGGTDYAYEEYAISFGFDDSAWLEYAYSPDFYGTGRDTRNYEISVEQNAWFGTVLGAGAGYFDVSELSGIGYGYWHFGFSRAVGQLDLDLRYHDTNRPVPFFSSTDRAASRVSLSARLQF